MKIWKQSSEFWNITRYYLAINVMWGKCARILGKRVLGGPSWGYYWLGRAPTSWKINDTSTRLDSQPRKKLSLVTWNIWKSTLKCINLQESCNFMHFDVRFQTFHVINVIPHECKVMKSWICWQFCGYSANFYWINPDRYPPCSRSTCQSSDSYLIWHFPPCHKARKWFARE